MQIDKDKIRNILIIRNDRFGEFLLNIPALRALKETFKNANIIAIVNPYVRYLAECIPFIDEVIEWRNIKHALGEKINLIRLLRRKSLDIAVIMNPSKEFNIFTYLAGIPIRLGYDRKLGFLLTHKIKDEKHLANKHEVEYNLELVGLIGAATQDKSLVLNVADNADILLKNFNIEAGQRLIAIHPWTSDQLKQWPLERFCELTKRISKDLKERVVLVGGKEESGRSMEVFGGLSSSLINLIGKTSLRQLAAVLKRCKLLISGDSGPVHLACAVGTPVLAIFRNDLPGKTAKRWGPWLDGCVVIEKGSLADISVDEVMGKIREKLGDSK